MEKKKKEEKQTKKPTKNLNFLWVMIGFILPPVGLVLFLIWRKNKKEQAKKTGVAALVAGCIWLFFGLSLLIDTAGDVKSDWDSVSKEVQAWHERTESNKTTITVIALTYCSHCKNYQPIIKKIAKENNIKLYWFEADEMNSVDLEALSKSYNTSYNGSSPFTFVTKGGKLLGEQVGEMDRAKTLTFLKGIGAIKN